MIAGELKISLSFPHVAFLSFSSHVENISLQHFTALSRQSCSIMSSSPELNFKRHPIIFHLTACFGVIISASSSSFGFSDSVKNGKVFNRYVAS